MKSKKARFACDSIRRNEAGMKRGQKQSVFFSIVLGVLVIGVIGFLVLSNFKISQKRARLTGQIESLREQIQTLEQRKQELEGRIAFQKSEEYLEEIARDKLNLKNPGEEVVTFIQEKAEEKEIKETKNFLAKFFDPVKSSLAQGLEKIRTYLR